MNILLTTDFSYASEHSMEFALELFDATSTHFTILHVVHLPHAGMVISKTLEEDLEQHAIRKLEAIRAHLVTCCPGISVDVAVRVGVFKSTVQRWVEENDVQFLVMGTNGTSGFFEKLVGGNTREVVDTITIPTLVIPMEAPIHRSSNILMAVSDLDFRDREVLHTYFSSIRSEDTQICVLTIADRTVEYRSDEEYLDILPPSLRSNATRKVEHSDQNLLLEDQLLTYAHANDFDLIIVFPQSRNWFQRVLHRSVTTGVLKQSSLPLLIVR